MYCTNKKADKISIPQDVTEIGEWAFYECRFAEDFVLEAAGWRFVNSLAIKDNIVMYCTNRNAQKITIPEGLVKIGKRAFERCELLESVQIPNSVQEIEEYAFHGCSSLYSLTIPDSANVSEDAFGLGCEVARG